MPARMYDTAEELQKKIDEYFNLCENKKNPKRPTYTGLAYHLGFASRQSIWEYSTRSDELSLPVKRAMLKIEETYEQMLGSKNATGSIFALKNRGWTDKQEISQTTILKMDKMSDEDIDKELEELES